MMPANKVREVFFDLVAQVPPEQWDSRLAELAGVPVSTVRPRSASRVFNLGSARLALTALLSFLIISGGVPLGAAMPWNEVAS